MTKANVKKECTELFNKYMGIKVPASAITLMELTEGEGKINYVYFVVGNRHYVYQNWTYKSFKMYPDETLSGGVQLEYDI